MTGSVDVAPATNGSAEEPVEGGAPSSDVPVWLSRIAVAETLSPEVVTLAALSAGVKPPADRGRALVDHLVTTGRADAGSLHLLPGAQRAFLARLQADPGVDRVRSEMVATGLANEAVALSGQLAVWARQGGDWPSLEAVWLRMPVGDVRTTPGVLQAFAAVPGEKRREHPGLSCASAFVQALDADSGRFDLDRFLAAMIGDGRTLHSDWMQHEDVDAAVMAGVTRMLARSSLTDGAADPAHEQPFAVYRAISQFIAEQNDNGRSPGPLPLASFHAAASLVMILRTDWLTARQHAELAIAVGRSFTLVGLLASAALAVTQAMMGSQSGYERAERSWQSFATVSPALAASVESSMLLPRMVVAVRSLNAGATRRVIEQLASGDPLSRWFHFWPLRVWIETNAAMLWLPPEQALAEFDSKTSGLVVAGGDEFGVWHPLLMRARAELLINTGALDEAMRVVAGLGRDRRGFSLVTAARLQLARGDFPAAISLVDEGVHSSQVAVYERAHLQTIKAAAMELSGLDAEAADRQLVAACLVSRESGTLIPFAMLPSDARTALLARHREHPDGSPCVLAEPIAAGSFDPYVRDYARPVASIKLSRREQVLLPLLASSLTLREIADQLYVSANTVRNQGVTLRKKLSASNRAELAERARGLGLLPSEAPQS